VASLFLLRTIVVVIVLIALFLYCIFKSSSSIRLSSRKCVINSSVFIAYKLAGWPAQSAAVCLWRCLLRRSGTVPWAESCTVVVVGGHCLFNSSDTFAVRCIV